MKSVKSNRSITHCHCRRCGWVDVRQKNCNGQKFFKTNADSAYADGLKVDGLKVDVDGLKVDADDKKMDADDKKMDADGLKVDADSAYVDDKKVDVNGLKVDVDGLKVGADDKKMDVDGLKVDATNVDSADVMANAKADDVNMHADLNILAYHKAVFIEMVKTFRKDITMSDINNEIIIYKNELNMSIYGSRLPPRTVYVLKDFKNEINLTLLPILQIIFINNDINKELVDLIIYEIQNILDNNDQLMLLLMEFSIFLKILQPYIYAKIKSIEGCINKFLNVRIQSNDIEEELFMIYNNQNMILYNIFFLFSKKISSGRSKLILTTEFLELAINKKIKNIMQISRDNKYKRINLHLFQCTQCSEIFDNEIINCCPCGQTFCSKDCQTTAWATWHKKICPNRQITKRQCLGCMKYFKQQDIFKCTRCMSAKYCGKECQKRDWKYHKAYCNSTIFDSK